MWIDGASGNFTQLYQEEENFLFPYSESIDIMLRILSIQINDKIHSDKDLQILYRKIIRLMSKVGIFPYDTKRLIQRLDINILGLRNLKNNFTSEGIYKYPDVDISLKNDLITKIEYFKKEFLNSN